MNYREVGRSSLAVFVMYKKWITNSILMALNHTKSSQKWVIQQSLDYGAPTKATWKHEDVIQFEGNYLKWSGRISGFQSLDWFSNYWTSRLIVLSRRKCLYVEKIHRLSLNTDGVSFTRIVHGETSARGPPFRNWKWTLLFFAKFRLCATFHRKSNDSKQK